MKWVGLTGGIGSGKSTVSNMLRGLGFDVVNADTIANELLEKGNICFSPVLQAFGRDILGEDGEIDRSKLAEKVFQNKSKLQELESIVHPEVQRQVKALRKSLDEQGKVVAFYDVPLLFEKNLKDQFDLVLLVTCTESQQVERVMSRNGFTEKQVRDRMQHQMPLSEKERMSDVVIDNSGSATDLPDKIHLALKAMHLTSPMSSQD